jgi:hypothetical protein
LINFLAILVQGIEISKKKKKREERKKERKKEKKKERWFYPSCRLSIHPD